MKMPNDDVILTEAIYGLKSQRPLVNIRWGNKQAQFSPDEARRLALRILATAEASIGDAWWYEFASQRLKLGRGEGMLLMSEFREWRLKTEEEN